MPGPQLTPPTPRPPGPAKVRAALSSIVFVLAGLAASPCASARPEGNGEGSVGGGTKPTDERIWREGDAQVQEQWQEEKEDEEFFEEEEEEEPAAPAVPLSAGRHEIVLEFRDTDIFDEPTLSGTEPAPIIGPPPDRLYYGSYSVMPNHTNYIGLEVQQLFYDGEDGAGGDEDNATRDAGWAMISWDRTLSTGARLYFDSGCPWAEGGGAGFWFSAEYGWRAGLNLDLAARLQRTNSASGVRGWRVAGEAEAALTEKTALEAKGWYYWDGDGIKASRQQIELAQYVAHRTGLHVRVRRNVISLPEVPWEESADKRSVVTTLEMRHRLREKNTLLRGAFRWYFDSEDVTATGVSVGADQPFGRGSFGAHYRLYMTNEDVTAGTWWVALKLTF